MSGAEASVLSSQISLLTAIVRDRLARALGLEVSDEVHALLVEAQEGLESIVQVVSAVAPIGAIDDDS
jgi:hypothetical protein